MDDSNAGDDVRRFLFVPANGIAGFDEKMVFAFVIPDGFGPGLREEQNIHFGVIPMAGQAFQRAFPFIRPDDVAVDGEKGFVAQKRKRLFQSAARFQGFSLFGYFDGQALKAGNISGQLLLEMRDIDDDSSIP